MFFQEFDYWYLASPENMEFPNILALFYVIFALSKQMVFLDLFLSLEFFCGNFLNLFFFAMSWEELCHGCGCNSEKERFLFPWWSWYAWNYGCYQEWKTYMYRFGKLDLFIIFCWFILFPFFKNFFLLSFNTYTSYIFRLFSCNYYLLLVAEPWFLRYSFFMLILLQKYIYLEASDAADKETHIKLIIALLFFCNWFWC